MRKLVSGFIIFLTISLLLVACGQDDSENKSETEKETVTPVETVVAQSGDLIINKTVYGRTSPIKQVPVLLQQAGEIDVLKVENGDYVNKDDHIATIKTAMGSQKINAPKAGEIANLQASEGMFVSNEDPLALIVDLDELNITFSVTSDIRELFKKEQKLDVSIEDNKYKATIATIDTMPDETGLYPIEAKVENKDNVILPGMIAQLIVPEKKVKKTIIVPTEAIITESDDTFIFVVDDAVAKKVAVEVKETQSEQTAIKGDVNKNDQIIVSGQLTLSDGSKVNVVKEGDQS